MPNSPPASRGQHHSRLAWITGAGLVLAALLAFGSVAIPGPGGLWYAIAKPEADGG